jgi:hypothetical protein
MKAPISALAAVLLLLVFWATGCGGGGGSSTTTGEAVAGAAGKEGEATSTGKSPGAGESGSGSEAGAGQPGAGGASGSGTRSGGGESEGGGAPSGAGESPAGATAPKAASKSDFVVKANALCVKRREQVQAAVAAIFKGIEGKESESSRQSAVRKLVDRAVAPKLEAEAEELRALEPPRGDAGKVEAIAAAIEAGVAEAREDPQAFIGGGSSPLTKPQRLARRYGIGACGRVSY